MSLAAWVLRPTSPLLAALRTATVAALAVDAIVHLRLAPGFALGYPEGINGGNLFRLAAAAAVVAAVVVALRGTRAAFLFAAAVLAGAFGALIVSTYVNVPTLGPIPSMYEPVWYRDKTITAVAEGLGALTALLGAAVAGRRSRVAPAASSRRSAMSSA